MREIKFRAWSKETGKMFNRITLNGDGKCKFACNLKENGKIDSYAGTDYPNDCILMQYAGLKDKNGKEIYEGDIIVCRDMHDSNIFDGVWGGRDEDGMTKPIPQVVKVSNNPPYNFIMPSDSWCHPAWWEVIGNIYENPELLNPPTNDK